MFSINQKHSKFFSFSDIFENRTKICFSSAVLLLMAVFLFVLFLH